ncbi:281aa long hypothetical protein [Pyrococcus horikoshii OT3]|uniref:Uncharacterized protein n=2 Tax=Pyrococcus horikoshii TaxID=53953 RepID=O59316_PYRHO|nr:281aa long hypothetical protein [Pyrococcus horikoshii OT3]
MLRGEAFMIDIRDVIGTIIILGIMIWIVMAVIAERRGREKAKKLFNLIRVEDDKIVLPRKMRIKKGRIKLQGEWKRTSRGGRYYHISKEFKEKDEFEGEFIELRPTRFKLIMSKDEKTLLEGEAYLLEDENVIIPIIPSYEFSLERSNLEVSWESDFVSAVLRVNGNISGIVGGNINKARQARVEIRTENPKVSVQLFKGKEGEFKYEPLKNKLILITNMKAIDLKKLRKLEKPFIYGHGEFYIILILDIPFKKDVIDSMKIKVTTGDYMPEGEIRKILLS